MDRHRLPAYRAALTVLGSHAEADEVAQDAFVLAWQRLDSFRGDASFRTWLLKIAWHQTDEPPPPPPPPPPVGEGRVVAPRRPGQPLNIRVDATITDQQGSAAPVKKTVSVVVADSSTGSVRTLSTYPNAGVGNVPLNMDAETTILADGKLRLSLRLQYDLPSPVMLGRPAGGEERQPTKTSIVEGLNLVVENGKSIVAAQSADPVSDRQVVLEVKATLLK